MVTIAIYFVVLLLMVHWVWQAVQYMSEHNDSKEDVCMAETEHHGRLDVYTIAKYALVWGLFPLHYLYTSVSHLRKMKRFLIDGSKQIVADVTLKPTEVINAKCVKSEWLMVEKVEGCKGLWWVIFIFVCSYAIT